MGNVVLQVLGNIAFYFWEIFGRIYFYFFTIPETPVESPIPDNTQQNLQINDIDLQAGKLIQVIGDPQDNNILYYLEQPGFIYK